MSTRERREPPESPDTQAEAVCGPCEACGCEIGTDGNCVWCAGDYPPHTHDPVTPSAEPDGEACTHSPRCMAFPDECCRPAPAQDGEVAFVESMLADRAQDGAEVETLAWVLNAVEWPDGMGDDDYSREQAKAVVAWLAQRDEDRNAAVAAKALRDAAKAIRLGLDTSNHIGQGVECACKQLDDLAARAAAPAGDER